MREGLWDIEYIDLWRKAEGDDPKIAAWQTPKCLDLGLALCDENLKDFHQ